jgi:ferritin-like metal-binding protein YciE
MTELDGTWDVRRVGGMLPPLYGVRKRIHGARGTTLAADGRLAAGFDVVGTELRYRTPFTGFVDVLEADDGGFRGRVLYRGRELGQFAMNRSQGRSARPVDDELVKHLDEAHAMEQDVLRMLDGLISSVGDDEIRQALEQHKLETENHVGRLRARLEAHDAAPSTVRQMTGIVGALAKLPLDLVRGDKAARAARDAYTTEHMEIAAYELLRRVAQRAGDDETVAACDEILAQERAMAETIAASWDRFVEVSLRDDAAAI